MEQERVYRGTDESMLIYVADSQSHAAEYSFEVPREGAAIVQLFTPDWNRDLSPWPARALEAGGEPFSGGADEYLERLTERMERVERTYGFHPRRRALCGYSLAGLFSLYAATRTDRFVCVGSASGSMWYEGWTEYLAAHPVHAKYAYLSLGGREKMTRSERMARVEEETQKTLLLLKNAEVCSTLVMNPGGHFRDHAGRMNACFHWMEKAMQTEK